ncbi:MAG: hypothetical protein U0359_36550 [Byssovorax sp.]
MAKKKTAAKQKTRAPVKRAASPRPAKPPAKRAAKRVAKRAKKSPPRPFLTDRPELALSRFLPIAEALGAEGLSPFRLDPELVRENVARGLAAVETALGKKKLPGVDRGALRELPTIALALAHAAGKVARPALPADVEKRLAQMRPMREAALRQLEVFALLDLIPAHVPAAIRKGSGPLDAAQDAVAIPSVFQDNEELIGHRHPFTSAMLKKLGEDGSFLVERLAPLEEAREAADQSPEALAQDQLWALLRARHEALRVAGALLFGLSALDAQVPPLGAPRRD